MGFVRPAELAGDVGSCGGFWGLARAADGADAFGEGRWPFGYGGLG